MDPSPLAQNVATLVGLICNFRQKRGAKETLDHRQFIEWLEYHRHQEVKDLIVNTHHLSREVDDLLRRDQQEILCRLGALDEVFAQVLSKLDGFSGLVGVLAPGIAISKQAEKILIMFADSNADLLIPCDARNALCLSTGHGVNVDEPRFLEDDLTTLVALGFLARDFGSDGNQLFKLTRSGAKYASLLKQQNERLD